jgi:hypothetical protein
VNARWPNRDKASDGTIGDAAHQAEAASGHNPDDTAGSRPEWDGDPDTLQEVRAWDMDSDLGEAGATAQMLVDHLRALPGFGSHVRYMIYNRKIYHSSTTPPFAPAPYSGASAHTEHIHFSGAYTQTADQDTSFNYRLDEVGDVAMTPEERADLVRSIWAYDPGLTNGDPWPGISDETFGKGNGTVAPGTALTYLLKRQRDNDAQMLAALKQPISFDVPALAAAIVAAMPAPAGAGLTAAQLQEVVETGVRNVLRTGTGA